MPTIAINNEVVTAIDLFSSEPERQQELVDALIDSVPITAQQAGFISISIHKSTDGVRVATYLQWQTREDYEAFINSVEGQQVAETLSEFPKPDSHIYEIFISRSNPEGSIPKISKGGYLTHFAEFRMKPENQQPMLDLAREEIVRAMENPGLVSANFHRSIDGTRVINYGQWRSQADFEAILKVPGFEPGKGYWVDFAENEFHLYEVVFAESVE
jgi:quinol monooxygenase YgiN